MAHKNLNLLVKGIENSYAKYERNRIKKANSPLPEKDSRWENSRALFVKLNEDCLDNVNREEQVFSLINPNHPNKAEIKKTVKTHRKKKNFSTVLPKIEAPAETDKFKSYNDFSDDIFQVDPKTNIYLCPVAGCNKKFPTLGRIKRHYIIHTDIKPFKCKNKKCNKRFSRKDNMQQHYRMHCQYGTPQ